MRPVVFVLAAALLAAACSSPNGRRPHETQPQLPLITPPKTATTSVAALDTQARAWWAKRDQKDDLERAIGTWEKILESEPRNTQVMVSLARAYYFLADAHLAHEEGDREDLEATVYQRAADYGERALLILDPDLERAMIEGTTILDVLVELDDPRGVPALYWYCVNLARYGSKRSLSVRLAYAERLRFAMERARELEPDYDYAGPDRFLGSLLAAVPTVSGKDLRKSEEYFRVAVERAPEYLATRVVEAQFLAVERDDPRRYRELLEFVLASPDSDNPDIAPENRAAKKTAKMLLDTIDERF